MTTDILLIIRMQQIYKTNEFFWQDIVFDPQVRNIFHPTTDKIIYYAQFTIHASGWENVAGAKDLGIKEIFNNFALMEKCDTSL